MISDYKKQFVSGLSDLSSWEGWRLHESMTAFLSASFWAIRKSTEFGEAAERCESEYMRIVGRCQKPNQTMGRIKELYFLVVDALGEDLRDFIGPVFMETSASEHMGQFFTPHDVCVLMAHTQLGDAKKMLKRMSHITIDEPACGACAMILAVCSYLKKQGVNYQTRCGFRLTDLDHEAFMAAYIQMSLAGVPARVIHGNTLTLEIRDQAITPMMMLRPWLARESTQSDRSVLAKAPVIPATSESDEAQDVMDMFELFERRSPKPTF